jgi:hypothetical protein
MGSYEKMEKRNVTHRDCDAIMKDVWATQRKFDALCEFLGIAFIGGDYEEKACYVVKDKDKGK